MLFCQFGLSFLTLRIMCGAWGRNAELHSGGICFSPFYPWNCNCKPMFWGFETNISSPSHKLLSGICLTKTSSLRQVTNYKHSRSLDVSIAVLGFLFPSSGTERSFSDYITYVISDSTGTLSSSKHPVPSQWNPFLSRSLRNPVYGGLHQGPRGWGHSLSSGGREPWCVRPGPRASEQGLSHGLWEGWSLGPRWDVRKPGASKAGPACAQSSRWDLSARRLRDWYWAWRVCDHCQHLESLGQGKVTEACLSPANKAVQWVRSGVICGGWSH